MGEVNTNGREVTLGDFAALARRRGWTKEFLAERFREQLDDPRHPPRYGARRFFESVFQGQYAATVIPFNSVLAFYRQELGLLGMDYTGRRCQCGCRAPVFDRRKWATAACRKRSQRNTSRTAIFEAVSA